MGMKKITTKTKIMYGIGDVFGGGAFLIISLLFLNYLTDVAGLKPALAGIMFLIGKIWDAVSDPLMGVLSDRTKSRFGRRRVYFLVAIIPIFISFFMLWYSIGAKSQGALFAYYLIAYLLFNTVFTMVMIPYNSILPDMTTDYKERASMSGIRIMFSGLSAVMAGVIPSIIIGNFGDNTKLGYMVMAAAFGIFYALPWIIVFYGTWENTSHVNDNQEKFNVYKELSTLFKNKCFKIHAGMFISSQTAVDFLTTLFVYYLTYYLLIPKDFSLVLGVLLVTQIIVMPIHMKVSRKFGKTMPLKIGLCVWIGAMVLSFFLKPGMNKIFILLVAGLSGVGTSASVFVPWSILPEISDVDEMISSKRREGMYAGMATLLRKTAQALSVFLIGVILEWIGYIPNVAQKPGTLLGIRIMFSVTPIVFILSALYFATRFTMTEEKYEMLMGEIGRLKCGGKKEQAEEETVKICEELTGVPYDKLWNASSHTITSNNNLNI